MSEKNGKYFSANNPVNTKLVNDECITEFSSTHVTLPDGKTPVTIQVLPALTGVPPWAVCIDINNPNHIYVNNNIYSSNYIAFNDVIPVVYHFVMTNNDINLKFFDHEKKMIDQEIAIYIPDEKVVTLYRYANNALNGWLVKSIQVCTTNPPKKQESAGLDLTHNDIEKLLQKMHKSLKEAGSIDVSQNPFKKLNKKISNIKLDPNKFKSNTMANSSQLSFDFEEDIKENNNMINPICKYSTFKIDQQVKFISKSYKYDNIPHSYVSCSCPSLVSPTEDRVVPCQVSLANQTNCPMYEAESSLLATYTAKEESPSSHSYSVTVQTTNNLDRRADIVNNMNGQITYSIGIPSSTTDQQILEDADLILEQHFSYLNLTLDNFTRNTPLNSQPTEKQKKSFILSLV